MRVLLQNTETKLYFVEAGEWTEDPVKATDFEEVENAAQAFHIQDLTYARIVVEPHSVSRHTHPLVELFKQLQPPV